MPLYDYECPYCGKAREELRKVACRECPGPTCTCGWVMKVTVSPGPKPNDHLYPFLDPFMATEPILITSHSHREKELKKRGLQEGGGGKQGTWYWDGGVRRLANA